MNLGESSEDHARAACVEYLERAHLILVMSENDAQLQKFTNIHLPHVIGVAGKHVELVAKIQEILAHYGKRVKTNLEISFPVEKLLELLDDGPIPTNLSLVYLKYAKDRMKTEDHVKLLPRFLEAAESKINHVSQCYEVLSLCIPGFIALSSMDRKNWPEIKISPSLTTHIVRFWYCIIVFNPLSKDYMKDMVEGIMEGHEIVTDGSSNEEFLLIARKVAGESLSLTSLKVAIIKLASAGFVEEKASFHLLVIASGVNVNLVDDAAESALKKVNIQECVDDKGVVDRLMNVYLGSVDKKNVKQIEIIHPLNSLMKQKVLPFLTRSATAPSTYMNNIKICLDGISATGYTKLLQSALQFMLAVLEKMPVSGLTTLGPSLYTRLKKLSYDQRIQSTACDCLIYRCLAQLGKSHPPLVHSDLPILETLFQLIPEAPEDVSYALVDCLVAWLPGFCSATNSDIAANLQTLIASYVVHNNNKCRLVALKYIEALISEDEVILKWMLLHASGDSRDEIRNEAMRLLELSLRKAVPSLTMTAAALWDKLGNEIMNIKPTKTENDNSEGAEEVTKSNSLVYQMCARYLWAVGEHECGLPAELRIVDGDENWLMVAPKLACVIKELPDDVKMKMTRIALHAVKESNDVHVFRIAACFASVYPVELSSSIQSACIQRARGSARIEMSSVVSFLTAYLMTEHDRIELFNQCLNELKTNAIAGVCWLAAATVCVNVTTENMKNAYDLHIRLVELAEEGYNRPTSLLEAALGSLAWILKQYHSSFTFSVTDEERNKMLSVCEKIASSRKDTLSSRAREAAVQVIGFSVTKSDQEFVDKTVARLYLIGEGPPQPELQLTVGSSLFDAILGPNSSSRRQPYIQSEETFVLSRLSATDQTEHSNKMKSVLECIVDEKCVANNHHLRRASLVWLLVLVQKAHKMGFSVLDEMLDRIQSAFADGLTENDDFAQDMASKGMGTVYQMAGPEQRKELVAGLMTSLAEGRKSTTKVSADTVIFEKGQLGKSPDGENLTTYKELCSLATDLNQPDLVYKFMQLAKHNSTWNSKKGAAFGFGAVLEQAREELDPYIGQLVPKLFRYRYDPDMKVQQSMRSIWAVLTQSKRNVVDEFADVIVVELIPSLTNKEWRVRESACLALSDLLRGHDTSYMHSRVPELIEIVFRVRDDVKESVRQAAERTIESLRKLVIKLSSTSNKEKAHLFLDQVLPVLLEKGVNSSIGANKGFSLSLLMELAKTAGAQLVPYLAELIPTLLDAISASESSVLNYIAVRSTNTQLEALDDARAQMARTSPMMTAIYDLMPQINGKVMSDMQPRICEQLRASVGTSTRAGAAQLITNLALRAPQLMMDHRPQCDKFFNALLPGVRDRNPSIRKQFASTLSYLAKYASPSHMGLLITAINKDLISENEEMKQSAKNVLKSLSANCSELLSGYATQLVPYVFLETCHEVIKGDEASTKRHEEWSELWAELVPSTSGAVRLYRTEIIKVAIDVLQNNTVWSVRGQAGRMLAETAAVLSDGLEAEEASSVIGSLLPLLSGRTWKGKENVVLAIAAIMESSGKQLSQLWTEKEKDECFAILSREAERKKKDYAVSGLSAVGTMAAAFKMEKAAKWLLTIVDKNIEKAINPQEDGESEDETEGLTNLEKEVLLTKYVSHNLIAFARSLRAYSKGVDATASVAKTCEYLTSASVYWKSKQEFVNALQETVEKWELTEGLDATVLVESLLSLAEQMCEQQKKTIAAQALQVVMKMAERRNVFNVDWIAMSEKMKKGQAVSDTGLIDRLSNVMEIDQ